MKKRFTLSVGCAVALALCAMVEVRAQGGGGGGGAQVPQLPFKLVDGFFKYPAYSVIGRLSGVASSPDGQRIVALIRGHKPVLEFNAKDGSFVRTWGEGSTMFHGAHALRYDAEGNLWYVNAGDNVIAKFDKEGRTVGVLGNNPEPWTWLTHVIERAIPGKANFYHQTDIAWTKDGSSFVADGYGNSRVAHFDKDGNFVNAWGERGSRPGEFNTPHGIAIDNNDVIYVADRGNNRIQTFDTKGALKNVWNLPTAPWSLCMTSGPAQVLFVGSVSRVYKMSLDGKILGQFGRAGRMPGTIDSIHQLACPDEKTLILANLYGNRLDKWVSD
jgi:DNA-binding beta-propeller fold protein YncE